MIAGHAMLAFAMASSGAIGVGVSRHDALTIGVLAGAFALVPDVDMAYAVVGLLSADVTGVWSATEAFWSSSTVAHRAITHSLVLGLPATVGFALVAGDRHRRLAGGLLGTLVVIGALTGGLLAGSLMALYVLAGAAVAIAARRAAVSVTAALWAAGIGLLTHPVGDVFTGTPPAFFYPVGPQLITDRIPLAADATVNLLSIFGIELAAIWIGVFVAARLRDWRLRDHLEWHAIAGAGYGIAAVVMPPPTLDVSYHFVFSVGAVGGIGAMPLRTHIDRHQVTRAIVTGLTAVTVGGITYTVIYLLI